MSKCICGHEAEYVGLNTIEGCANPKCQHYSNSNKIKKLDLGFNFNFKEVVPATAFYTKEVYEQFGFEADKKMYRIFYEWTEEEWPKE